MWRRVGLAVGFVWTLPNTLLGLILGALTFSKPRVERGVIVFDRRARGVAALLAKMHRTAMTVGLVMLGNVTIEGPLRTHEDHHLKQYLWLGPLFLPVYFLLAIPYGYRRHPMEKAAERATQGTRA